jgi:hypothetical protein
VCSATRSSRKPKFSPTLLKQIRAPSSKGVFSFVANGRLLSSSWFPETFFNVTNPNSHVSSKWFLEIAVNHSFLHANLSKKSICCCRPTAAEPLWPASMRREMHRWLWGNAHSWMPSAWMHSKTISAKCDDRLLPAASCGACVSDGFTERCGAGGGGTTDATCLSGGFDA